MTDSFQCIPFTVLGYPSYEETLEIIRQYIDGGATFLELGFPFSDPVADGPTLQAANQRSLTAGMTTSRAFDLLRDIRQFTALPIGLLVYYHLVFVYGVERFCQCAAECKVQTILIPDLPIETPACDAFLKACRKHGLQPVFMLSELTPPDRLQAIFKAQPGFLYLVGTPGVTGTRDQFSEKLLPTLQSLKSQTDIPVYVGFGIKTQDHVETLRKAGADGVIVGSALVEQIAQGNISKLFQALQQLFYRS